MAQPIIQYSFHAGEWAPQLNARVDLQKYHAGAALLRNFFVDYRGGASTRYGTKYVIQAKKSTTPVRLIPFQASFEVTYALEFGDFYVRFIRDGAPVLEAAKAITNVSTTNPVVITSPAHGFAIDDWVFIASVVGTTQVNNKYFKIQNDGNFTANTFALGDTKSGSNIDGTGYTAYVSGGTAQRVYTITTPYSAFDLALLKFAQNVNQLILCHPSYPPNVLTFNSDASWTLTQIVFGPGVGTPTGQSVATTLGAGTVNYAYVVSAVDANGQESTPSASATLASKLDLRSTGGTNTISWTAVSGAASYNVYKAELSFAGAIPAGSQFGFIGNCTGTSFIDSNIDPDFSQTPQIVRNPFQGAGVASTTITNPGSYSVTPNVTFSAAPAGGNTAIGQAVMSVLSVAITNPGTAYTVGQFLTFANAGGIVLMVTSVSGITQTISGVSVVNAGSLVGTIPTNPITHTSTSNPVWPNGTAIAATFSFTWKVTAINLVSAGAGYATAPTITFSAGAATATATLSSTSSGNPGVPSFHDQRLVLAAPPGNPQQFDFSQPTSYFNFNVSEPIQEDDAIEGSLVSGRLNSIKSLISMPSGLLALSDRQSWLINGGQSGEAVSPINLTAHAQSYTGANDVPPIVANYDILYVQSKNSIVRSIAYDFYRNVYTGVDISVLSSHLFFSFQILEMAWAEEPYKVLWAVRNDGILLSCTYLKEQELVGWAHHDTGGLFKSICSITEQIPQGSVDAVYVVVDRSHGGNILQYIERMADRYPASYNDTSIWCVDSGLQYSGPPATVFSGLDHLAGLTVTGLADGAWVGSLVVSASGSVTLPAPASVVTLGLAYIPQLQTLAIDTGEPTVQSKMKKVPAVTIRCQNTLGLSIGSSFSSLVTMKDLALGNLGSMSNAVVTNLVTTDVRTRLDPTYTVFGQYCIQQGLPYPATVLGVVPELTVGDTPK